MQIPVAQIRRGWSRYRSAALWVAIAILCVFSLVKLGSEFPRLLFDQGEYGAIDLRLRYQEVRLWFAHVPVYPALVSATYPPMSYAIFWLVLGWAPLVACRWLWAAASVLSLCWLGWQTMRESGARTGLERVFAMLLPLSFNATGLAIGNGQLILFLVPMLWAAILLIAGKQKPGWRAEVFVIALLLVSLSQPATASPFFWIVLFVPSGIRPAVVVIMGYVALTLLSAWFQPDDLAILLRDWIENARNVTPNMGYAHLHFALYALGLRDWALPASGLVMALLGAWTFIHRRLDIWLLLGVTAIVARMWTYHGIYDDVLIIFPMVTLFRIATTVSASNEDIKAAVLLAATVCVMLMPVSLLRLWHPPWPALYVWSHTLVWMATLVFLLLHACTQRRERALQNC